MIFTSACLSSTSLLFERENKIRSYMFIDPVSKQQGRQLEYVRYAHDGSIVLFHISE